MKNGLSIYVLPPFSALLLSGAFAACAHSSSEFAVDIDVPIAVELTAIEAVARCRDHADAVPPRPFVSDGCSAFPDGDWVKCCLDHDIEYWCGGTAEERRRADARLSTCVADTGHSILGPVMYTAVRMGGAPWWPVPWRWGFGWDYAHGYDPIPTDDNSKSTAATPSEREKEAK